MVLLLRFSRYQQAVALDRLMDRADAEIQPGDGEKNKSACKPGSVEDNHSSGPKVTFLPQATNPKTARTTPMFSYLVLLRVGFTMPLLLPVARCALTAPFHPYQSKLAVYSLLHWP
jgi:hypothetical protein